MERNKITNIIMIIIGILVLCAAYSMAYRMDLGNPTITFIKDPGRIATIQRPVMLFIGIISSISLVGVFLIAYPLFCLRKGISCIRFR